MMVFGDIADLTPDDEVIGDIASCLRSGMLSAALR